MSFPLPALLLGGLVLLVFGAEIFVRGASRIALMAGISPLVIGLTVVSLGTSSPEIAVSLQSSFAGRGDIALGNVVGSNICNVLLILGLAGAIAPLVVSQQLVILDVPVMIGVSILMLGLSLNGVLGRLEGAVLILGAIAYVNYLIRQSRRAAPTARDALAAEPDAVPAASPGVWARSVASIVGGLALLVLGSRGLVSGAVTVAQAIGVSELVIGLTIIAVGTSLPEIATTVIATIRGERDLAVGNAIGSNIFNILVVLGIAGVVSPAGVPVASAALHFDIPVMIAVAVACLPIFATGNLIARWEGFLFLGYYVAYSLYLVLESTGHAALPVYSGVMIAFVIPITVLTLVLVTWRHFRYRYALPPKR